MFFSLFDTAISKFPEPALFASTEKIGRMADAIRSIYPRNRTDERRRTIQHRGWRKIDDFHFGDIKDASGERTMIDQNIMMKDTDLNIT